MTTLLPSASLLGRAIYTYADVDRHLGLYSGTSRRWLNGYTRGGIGYEPVLRNSPVSEDSVTWGEFVETRLLCEFRDQGVSIRRLRPAFLQLGKAFGQYPLAHAHPFLDVEGRELLRQIQDNVDLPHALRLVVVRNGQGMMSSAVKRFVDAVDFDEANVIRVRPAGGSSLVVVDPERQGGRPVVRSVPTDVIVEQFNAGESVSAISHLWKLTPDEIESALRYELSSHSA